MTMFPSSLPIALAPPASLTEVSETETEIPNAVERSCAWCLQEQGLPFGHGSHGICQQHAERALTNWRVKRATEGKRG